MMKKILLTSVLLAGLISPAFAGPMAPTLAGPVPTSAGTGLAASYYKLTSAPGTLSTAATMAAAASGPTATFTALTVCFPSCGNTEADGSTLTSYISSNGKNLVGSSTTLGDAVTIYQGFIAIRSAGNETFNLTSDDGSELVIGGATIINDDGDHGLSGSSATVKFAQAGLYSFFVEDFEDAGVTGVTLLENGSAIATSDLYLPSAVPEPASMALLAAGVLGLGVIRRRA